MVFRDAKGAGWLPDDDGTYPKASHVGFGLVLGEDGKRFRTRSSEVIRLVDLLDEAKSRMLNEAKENQIKRLKNGIAVHWSEEELEQIAKLVGYAAVKYADLKNNRLTNYTFSFKNMLKCQGNTAVYLLYAYARLCSIIEKFEQNMLELKTTGSLVLDHVDERMLGLHLMRFSEVVGSAEETSRVLLCEATATVMRKCFHLLGIVPLNKI